MTNDGDAAADPVPQMHSRGVSEGVEGSGGVSTEIAPATDSAVESLIVGEQLPVQAVEESVQVTADLEGTTAVGGGSERGMLPLEEVPVGEQLPLQALEESVQVTVNLEGTAAADGGGGGERGMLPLEEVPVGEQVTFRPHRLEYLGICVGG